MAIPKTLLKNAMQSTRVLKPDEELVLINSESELINTNSKLTFRKDNGTYIEPVDKDLNPSFYQPDLIMLSSSEKKIIIKLCEKKEKQENGKFITKPINLSNISAEIMISITTIKKLIQRLEKKGVIDRMNFKPGPEGWTIYSIPLFVFKGLSQ